MIVVLMMTTHLFLLHSLCLFGFFFCKISYHPTLLLSQCDFLWLSDFPQVRIGIERKTFLAMDKIKENVMKQLTTFLKKLFWKVEWTLCEGSSRKELRNHCSRKSFFNISNDWILSGEIFYIWYPLLKWGKMELFMRILRHVHQRTNILLMP